MFDFKNATKEELDKKYKEIAQEMGDYAFGTKKELKCLQDIIRKEEQILAFSSGLMDGNTWLITLTDRRIIFLDKGLLYGLKQSTIFLNKINSITSETRIIWGTITIADGGHTYIIKYVPKKTVQHFTNKLQDLLDARSSN